MKYAIIRARFNEDVTEGLLRGALRAFTEGGVSTKDVTTVEVPGSWEIPYAALQLANTKKYRAIVTLGAVIKGGTSHDYWINHAVFPELQRIARKFLIPVTLGIVTTNNEKQAVARSGNDQENRGYAAARAAIEMVLLFKK